MRCTALRCAARRKVRTPQPDRRCSVRPPRGDSRARRLRGKRCARAPVERGGCNSITVVPGATERRLPQRTALPVARHFEIGISTWISACACAHSVYNITHLVVTFCNSAAVHTHTTNFTRRRVNVVYRGQKAVHASCCSTAVVWRTEAAYKTCI